MVEDARRTTVVDSATALAAAIAEWRAEPTIAVDTESDSFFAYRDRTCLVQVSTRAADWIVDPLVVDIAPFGELCADPSVEKVFHASEGDILALKRDHRFTFAHIFDTFVAARAVGRKKLGLTHLVEELLGVRLAKDEQRSDWSRRPLTAQQVAYAFADTRHLLAVADRLREEVTARGPDVEEEVAHDCARMTAREPRPREVDPEGFERIGEARKMDPPSRQVLRQLHRAREEVAAAMNRATFRVVSDQALVAIALARPGTRGELARVRGVTPYVVGKLGDALLAAVRSGLALGPLPYAPTRGAPPDRAEESRFDALRKWRRGVAEARGVEVDVICGNSTLKAIARAAPRSTPELAALPDLDPLRVRRYGAAMVDAMTRPAAPSSSPPPASPSSPRRSS